MRAMQEMRVLIAAASRFLRPLNTDWRYAARTLPALGSYCSDLKMVLQRSLLADATINLRYGLGIARARGLQLFPRSWDYTLTQDTPVYASDITASQATRILSYERYPAKSFGVPVAWITSPTYPEIQEQLGFTTAQCEQELAWKLARAGSAAKLIFTTERSLNDFLAQSGESFRVKSMVIPFLILGLTPRLELASKWEGNELRLLFVGREAHRKGLPATLKAVIPLLKENPGVRFTIVSRMDDGAIDIPSLPNLRLLRETNRLEVLKLMSESHVLTMPSSRESYGFVYVEAMSQGCVPLGLNLPIQRELLGDNGILVSSQDAEEIRSALRHVMTARELYFEKARRGVENFQAKHAAEKVAAQFHAAMRSMGGG
jgi:glycosyltransferase involved in cell wall biosynthesis